jgi:putative peptidoglycan lipid II flippase
MAIEKQFEKMSEMLHSILLRIAIYLFPLSGIMFVLSNQIISILYQHGHFTSESVVKTASVFSVYLFGTFSFSASMIIARTFYALQNTLLPMLISTGISILSIPLYIMLSTFFGARGIALAAITGMTLQFLILYFFWINMFKLWNKSKTFFFKFAKVIIICSCGIISGLVLKNIIQPHIFFHSQLLQNFSICILVSIPSLLITFSIYELTGIQSIKATIKGLARK